MKKYPHGLTLNAVCAAIEDYQRHEDSVPEEGILAAFNTLLGHSDIAEELRSLERTADTNMAAAQALRDDMYHWKQRAEAAEAKLAELEKQGSEQKPFMHGIMTANGDAHFEDFCVSSDPSLLEDEIWEWNNTLADNEPKNRVVPLFTRPAPAFRLAELVQVEWTNEQCLEFLSIAFRHAEISGDIEMDDIRLAVKMVNAAAPEVE